MMKIMKIPLKITLLFIGAYGLYLMISLFTPGLSEGQISAENDAFIIREITSELEALKSDSGSKLAVFFSSKFRFSLRRDLAIVNLDEHLYLSLIAKNLSADECGQLLFKINRMNLKTIYLNGRYFSPTHNSFIPSNKEFEQCMSGAPSELWLIGIGGKPLMLR